MHASFNDCFNYSISKAVDQNKRFTIFIDADILVRPGAVINLIEIFKTLDNQYCTITGFTLDKFHVGKKSGGIHIYRTEALKLVHKDLDAFINDERPETRAKEIMHKKYGLEIFKLDEVTCMHDFFQFKKDIIRKVSFRQLKSAHLSTTYIKYYRVLSLILSDYHLANKVLLDSGLNPNNKSSSEGINFSKLEFKEKKNLSSFFLYPLFSTNIPFYFWFLFFKMFRRLNS